jgi:hypothetical protein
MKIDEILNDNMALHAFTVDNLFVGRKGATDIVKSIPDALITKYPKRWSWLGEDVFCLFEVNGVQFEIEEPYGDSSEYWIGKSREGGACPELNLVAEAFKKWELSKQIKSKFDNWFSKILAFIVVIIAALILFSIFIGKPITI